MPPVLALYEDVLSDGAALALAAAARMIFLVHGGVTVVGRALHDGETWHGEGAAALVAGSTGATCWRFELDAPPAGAAPGVTSREKLAAPLATLPADELLLRGDSVAFPPGGSAYPHRHQGPGIRCLIEGGIRIDTAGRSTSYGPGGAWYEKISFESTHSSAHSRASGNLGAVVCSPWVPAFAGTSGCGRFPPNRNALAL